MQFLKKYFKWAGWIHGLGTHGHTGRTEFETGNLLSGEHIADEKDSCSVRSLIAPKHWDTGLMKMEEKII